MSAFPICVIGNSHVGALGVAWAKAPPPVRDGVTMTFFGARAGAIEPMRLVDGVFVPTSEDQRSAYMRTSGGRDRIECGDYKAFVLVPAGISFVHFLKQVGNLGTVQSRKWVPVAELVSEPVFRAVIEARLEASSGPRLLEQIRGVSTAPILVCPQPCRSETFLERYGDDPRWKNASAHLPYLYRLFQTASDAVVFRHGGETIWQDPSTMRFPGVTKDEFRIGAISLGKGCGRRKSDTLHMNQSFGVLTLVDVFRRLDQLIERAPS